MPLHLLFAAVLLAASLPVRAADSAEAQVDNDRFVAGGLVRQTKPVEGDLFGIGGNVDVIAGRCNAGRQRSPGRACRHRSQTGR